MIFSEDLALLPPLDFFWDESPMAASIPREESYFRRETRIKKTESQS